MRGVELGGTVESPAEYQYYAPTFMNLPARVDNIVTGAVMRILDVGKEQSLYEGDENRHQTVSSVRTTRRG